MQALGFRQPQVMMHLGSCARSSLAVVPSCGLAQLSNMAVPWQPIDFPSHKQVLQVRQRVQQLHKQVLEPERHASNIPPEYERMATTLDSATAAFHKRLGLQPKGGWKPNQPHPDSPHRKVQRTPSDASTEMVPSPVARRWYEKEMNITKL